MNKKHYIGPTKMDKLKKKELSQGSGLLDHVGVKLNNLLTFVNISYHLITSVNICKFLLISIEIYKSLLTLTKILLTLVSIS